MGWGLSACNFPRACRDFQRWPLWACYIGIFGRVPFRDFQTIRKYGLSWPLTAFLRAFLLLGVVSLGLGGVCGLWGFSWACYSFCLRAVSTCKGGKAVFIPIFCRVCLCLFPCLYLCGACRLCLSLCEKRNSPLCGLFLLGWLCLFSPIEQKRTLRAGCRFGLLPLFCRGLPSSLWPWGLQYSTNLLYRWPRCVLYTCRR